MNTTSEPAPLLQVRGVFKHFGPVQALADVDLDVPAGCVTALCGDNGAGKTVLIKCIAGIHQPDQGSIRWEGREVHIRTPRDASALGIETVYQDLALADNLDIVANMFLGQERTHLGLLDEPPMEHITADVLGRLRVTTISSVRHLVGRLSGGQRQSVAVARAVMRNSKLVIMDEPTAALGVNQTAMVLDLVRTLRDRGLGVLIISHNLNDVLHVADRIAVLHLGHMVAQGDVADFDSRSIVEYMTTGHSAGVAAPSPGAPAEPAPAEPAPATPIEAATVEAAPAAPAELATPAG